MQATTWSETWRDTADGFLMRLHTRGPNVNALDGRISNATVMQS